MVVCTQGTHTLRTKPKKLYEPKIEKSSCLAVPVTGQYRTYHATREACSQQTMTPACSSELKNKGLPSNTGLKQGYKNQLGVLWIGKVALPVELSQVRLVVLVPGLVLVGWQYGSIRFRAILCQAQTNTTERAREKNQREEKREGGGKERKRVGRPTIATERPPGLSDDQRSKEEEEPRE